MKQNDNDWKFQSYKGTNLGYDMICESVNSDQEKKQGDVLNGYFQYQPKEFDHKHR